MKGIVHRKEVKGQSGTRRLFSLRVTSSGQHFFNLLGRFMSWNGEGLRSLVRSLPGHCKSQVHDAPGFGFMSNGSQPKTASLRSRRWGFGKFSRGQRTDLRPSSASDKGAFSPAIRVVSRSMHARAKEKVFELLQHPLDLSA